ncbi:hypothetical protein MWH28_04770 [Natroniella sulfidigena]|uniref:hypothetical protein n=1 Tax=Natroniella sulfidigena TaxID=723921 RepID=UPI002009FDFC|nr:hypothetical protein [Natroniella sulfidigena]MCK8816684.1 hypothetical protein [Natroniella sulfidigena]
MNLKVSKNHVQHQGGNFNWQCKICGKEICQQDLMNKIGNVYLEHYWSCTECGGKLKKINKTLK